MQNFATRVWERHYFQGSVNNGEDHVFLRFSEDLFGGLCLYLLPDSFHRACLRTRALEDLWALYQLIIQSMCYYEM